MTPLRRKRLLLLAHHVRDCKPYYSQFCELMYNENPSPVFWCLGMAFLTETGKKELDKLEK